MSEPPGWLFLIFPIWAALIISASVIYRMSRGKPIWYRDDSRMLFRETFASGSSHRTWYTKLGGARNALSVGITESALVIRPLFPFNLMFIPEIYGLEQTIPLSRLQKVEETRTFGSNGVVLEFEDGSGGAERVSLLLRRRDEFIDVLLQSPATTDLTVVEDSGP